jgi:hypothetical protein
MKLELFRFGQGSNRIFCALFTASIEAQNYMPANIFREKEENFRNTAIS